ncbi:MAG TPA: FAD-dependent monooxygenase [Limnobacter sp.]|nr:FAD-dependent monooxygenase [Limnobacter sp.]
MHPAKQSKTKEVTCDVLIVGHGPVGATMACLLGQYGVSTLIVDKAADILNMPRAIALDNEALRILQATGLTEDAFPKHPIFEVRMQSPFAGLFAKANTTGAIDCHPKLITFYQPELELALRQRHRVFPSVQEMANTDFLGFKEFDGGICAELLGHAGPVKVNAKYLLGADGASSRVRELIDLDFKGQTYAEDWLIVDVNQRDNQNFHHVEFTCSPDLPSPHMPAPGGRERWEFMLKPGQSREEALDDRYIRQLLEPWVGQEPVNIERKAVYRFHARCSKSFQRGRVFLVGDAAHITPPFVGQGLVAGLRDAFNLSWKISANLRGVAGLGALKSYDMERRPHAKRMINLAKFMGQMVMPPSRIRAMVVHNAMRSVRVIPKMRAFFEELEIKPKNHFQRGLFDITSTSRQDGFQVGATLPQGLVRNSNSEIRFSDDELGVGFGVIGVGCDIHDVVAPNDLYALHGFDCRLISIQARTSKKPSAKHLLEDMDNTFVSRTGNAPLVLMVRPDRVVMGKATLKDVGPMLKRCIHQLAT